MYSITAVLKVETVIIASITESFRKSCETSDKVCLVLQNLRYSFNWQRHDVFDLTLTDNLQYQSEFLDTDNIKRMMSKLTINVVIHHLHLQKNIKYKELLPGI